MRKILQTETYRNWESHLKDKACRAIIAGRVVRLANDLPGDVSSVGEGVFELRIHFGPGYRLYYTRRGKRIILLLCGGTKRRQSEDIEKAKHLSRELEGDDFQ